MIKYYENMKHECDMLNERVSILNNKIEMLTEENSNLNNQLQSTSITESNLRRQINELTAKLTQNQGKSSQENTELLRKIEGECNENKKKLEEQIEKYQKLMKDFDKKVSESSQFKTLKKLLQDKNTLIVQLKTKVANYENKE